MGWTRELQITCIAGFVVLSACSGSPGAGSTHVFSADLPISEEAPGVWQRVLPAGAYLVGARESDLDFRMTVEVQGKRTTLSDEIPRHGFQATVIALNEPALVRVEINNAEFRDWKGKATLSIKRMRDADATPDERELGFASFGLGGMQLALPTYAERELSVESFRDAARHFTAANDIAARADANYALGFTEYLMRFENAAAVAASGLAQADFEAVGNEIGIHDAITLRAMADIEIAWKMNVAQKHAERQALFRAADERLQVATKFFDRQRLNHRRDYAFNVRGVGILYSGDYENAVPIFEEAIRRAIAIGDTRERVTRVSNLAWTHNRLGFFEKSAREFEEILRLADRQRHARQYAYLVANYGLSAVAIGEFDSALAAQTEAHALFAEIGGRAEAANALSSIGGIYLRIGDPERALRTYALAIADSEAINDFAGVAATSRMAGTAAASLGRHGEALVYLRRAMNTEGKIVDVGRIHVLIGRALRELGDLRSAERELAHALQIDNALLRANALDERGRLRLARGESRRAIADFRAADAGFAALGVDMPRIETNTALSAALLARGETAEAARVADLAIALESRIRVKSANPEWRASFLSISYSPYEARIAAELAGNERNPDHVWRAFQIAARVRARAVSEQLAASKSDTDGRRDAVELLRAKLTAQTGRLESRLQRSGPDDPVAIELRRVAEVTLTEFASLSARNPATDDALALPESLVELQALLPADLAVLAYFTGDRITDVWLLTRNGIRHARTRGANRLKAEIETFVGELRKPHARRSGKELADSLLGHLLDGVAVKRLLILPDGPLNALPFATLPLPDSPGQQLIDRFVISSSPSLALALNGATPLTAPPTRVVIVSDPVYSLTDRRLATSSDEEGSGLRGSQHLSRLPYSAVEARAVSQSFEAGEATQLSGFDASTANVLALGSQPLRVLHFATHARGSDAPEDSGLLLSRFGADALPLPVSALTADDILHSGLHANLVVLSGCATGEGRELRGGGVLGLTHGFLANGSRSVIASLWPVEDGATARFMEEFYAAYRKSGRAAEALRIAQLRTRGDATNTVWSSFVVRANELP
jgi:CHAT domain-containing protein/tetratricopeptide (TPR) repeat protein